MATQEPNVYAGLAVVVGGLMHARPRFFAKVMGELLFWVGEDKMLYGSDYAIWEPKWQIEGLLDWDYPDDTFSDYPRWTTEADKILGLDAAALYDIDVPKSRASPRRHPSRGPRTTPAGRVRQRMTCRRRCWTPSGRSSTASSTNHHLPGLRQSCVVSAEGDVSAHLRLPTPSAPNFAYLMTDDARAAIRSVPGVAAISVTLDDDYTGTEINAAVARGGAFADAFRVRRAAT